MAWLFGQSQGWPVPLSGSTNPFSHAAQRHNQCAAVYLLTKDFRMKTQASTQSEQPTQILKPDFKHRISHSVDGLTPASPLGLLNATDSIVNRALGVLSMIQNEFDGDPDRTRSSDNVISYSLESVEKDLLDVRCLMVEFLEKNNIDNTNSGDKL